MKSCPICGRTLSPLEEMLSEHDTSYQCKHCWTRLRATGSGVPPAARKQERAKASRQYVKVPGRR
jgi:hypothetical protein